MSCSETGHRVSSRELKDESQVMKRNPETSGPTNSRWYRLPSHSQHSPQKKAAGRTLPRKGASYLNHPALPQNPARHPSESRAQQRAGWGHSPLCSWAPSWSLASSRPFCTLGVNRKFHLHPASPPKERGTSGRIVVQPPGLREAPPPSPRTLPTLQAPASGPLSLRNKGRVSATCVPCRGAAGRVSAS